MTTDDTPDTPDSADTPRIAPLAPRDWPPAMAEALAALLPPEPRHPLPSREPGRPKGRNLLGTMARHPALTRAYHTFNGHLLFATTLSLRQRELLILRVAALRRADYEWAQHVVLAGDAGIDDDEVARVAEGPDAPGWSPFEQALLRAVDELVAEAAIGDGTWATLRSELDEQQLMDLVFTVGAYDVLAMAMRSFGIELDDDLRRGGNELLFLRDR
jgi:alkylhydroperoxidase family enzyme